VETVSLAFDFLKDETGSIFTENDGNVENLVSQQQNKPAVYRFRPPQISAITKYVFDLSIYLCKNFLSSTENYFLEIIIMN